MNDMDYKPNSQKYKKEQLTAALPAKKKVEKVVTGDVKVKKSEARKLADIFISEDVANVKSYILMDVLVPTIKKAIVDIVTDGVNMIFFGGAGPRRSTGTASKISYSGFYDKRDAKPSENRGARPGFDYDCITIEHRRDAEDVLVRMDELIDTYGVASVGDLYDLLGVTCDNYMAEKYGWTNVRNARVVAVRGGYVLDLPKALPLSKQ